MTVATDVVDLKGRETSRRFLPSSVEVGSPDEHTPVSASVQLLTEDHIGSIYALHRLILEASPRPELVRPDDRQFFARHVLERGRVIGVLHDETLIAYGVVAFPGREGTNYGIDLGLPRGELDMVGHLEGASVHPKWRNRRLHRHLVKWRIDLLLRFGYRHICATAAPANIRSWHNLTAEGLLGCRLKTMYNGVPRFVLHRNDVTPVRLDLTGALPIALENAKAQAALFDDGYFLYGDSLMAGERQLMFAPTATEEVPA